MLQIGAGVRANNSAASVSTETRLGSGKWHTMFAPCMPMTHIDPLLVKAFEGELAKASLG